MQPIYHLKEPQIDREEDVRTIIQTFLFQFSEKAYGGPSFNRPACCFAPHIYGAGKTFLGQNFLAYLNIFAERECSNAQTFQQLHSSNDNPQPSALKVPWKHFAEQTLSVILELRESFFRAPFPRRKDAAHVASTIIRELNLDDAIDYLLEQFQKQYLFLMIDELSHLSYLTKYYSELGEEQFIESDPKYVPFRNFFRILRDLLIIGKVIVYLAGRTAEISPLSDTRSSRVSLHMLRLNPFNLHDINEYIELATYDGKSLKDWLLPSDDLRHRFVELLKKEDRGYIPDTSTAKGVFFEFVFMKIFRFRLLTFLHSNSSPIVHSAIPGIFEGSFIEQDNVSYSMESTKSNDIPILRDVSDSFSDHYGKYLQRCGIFVPKEGNSSGPDAYVVFHNGQTRYVVGFSFKFYHKSEFSKRDIEEEAKKFLKEVVSVLNYESCSSVQLCFQFVVIAYTNYDRSVFFSVEDASYLVTEHSAGSILNESSRSCLQLVIVSQKNLERFFGRENFDILRKIDKASRDEFSKYFSV
ncbi:archaeal ATPase [Galdieria sulphuraria]|uniref:Archaeal ATPase n=1 Tax=Galdieria sulphuraria TaxID=130081 RepID=M2X8W1_GALSU|nr:archaeal ATPase [Galdieria sulphuraria]EME26262.1 archaeal ATPase [Galdieria sulphuraria]|eukprot:XP_005702782.1 archaeal ATPase [Galdieria sulphuraria]